MHSREKTLSNPLLNDKTLPAFDQIEAEHFVPAIKTLVADVERQVEQCLNNLHATGDSPSWENLLYPIEEQGDRLDKAWSTISHLNGVMNSEAIRDAYAQCLPVLTEHSTKMGQHAGLFQACLAIEKNEAFGHLTAAQQKAIQNSLRDFKLAGIDLSEADKKRYGEIKNQLADLSTVFSNNVLDATQAYSKHITDADMLRGLPASSLEAAASLAKQKDMSGYLVTLDIPSYLPVMQYCENRALRQELYEAYVTRASELGPNAGQWDNTDIIKKTLELRQDLAALLGYEHYAELSMATKMAASAAQAVQFLNQLADKSVNKARKEFDELQVFAKQHLGLDTLEAWDIAFATEAMRLQAYDVSQEALRPYFPADKVIRGMFSVVNKLYSIDIAKAQAPSLWHKDVGFYEITRSGEPVAYFYLDLYAREAKRGGAWMADCRTRRQCAGQLQLPVAYLTCNFSPPVNDKPSLLTHNEVTTLFHEFGHGLHHMLTEVDCASVSGISGVPWDAVELPSQFMENWCWEEQALALFARHHESDEPLPKALLDKMLAAKNFQSAMQMVRQLEFGLFDLLIHSETALNEDGQVQAILNKVRAQVSAYPTPGFNRFQNGFSHIFAGGYAAGYYSYKWAELLSADAFSLFEEQGIFDAATGEKFLSEILACGGSEEPAVLFENFRGRPPTPEALLRHSGIAG